MATTGGIVKKIGEDDGNENGDNNNDDPISAEKRTERGGGSANTFIENALKTHTMEISKLF